VEPDEDDDDDDDPADPGVELALAADDDGGVTGGMPLRQMFRTGV